MGQFTSTLMPVWLGLFLLQPAAATQVPTSAAVKSALAAYERSAGDAKPSPRDLAKVAHLVLTRLLASRNVEVWSEACRSSYAPETASCTARLRALLESKDAPISQRAKAGAALMAAGETATGYSLATLVKDLPPASLAAAAPYLSVLPARDAAPLLIRLAASPEPAHQTAACRVMGHVDLPEVRQALTGMVERSVVGSAPWSVCTVARARLREGNSIVVLNGAVRYLAGADLLDAVVVMLEIGHEHGDFLLRKVTREAPPVVRIEAAGYLVQSDPEYAAGFADRGLQDANPPVRAQALVLERKLRRAPAQRVRAALTDADELVQLRAVETILDWADRADRR